MRQFAPVVARLRSMVDRTGLLHASPSKAEGTSSDDWIPRSQVPPVDIEAQTVTLLAEEDKLNLVAVEGTQIVVWAKVPVSNRFIQNGIVIDPPALGDQISSTLKRLGFSRSSLSCAVSGLYSDMAVLDLPMASGSELENLVHDETSRQLGIELYDRYVFWQIMEKRTFGQTVFVLAVPREAVLGMVRALDHARIRPKSIDLAPLALIRWANRDNVIVAKPDRASLDIAIVRTGVPRYLKTITFTEEADDERLIHERLLDALLDALEWHDHRNPDRPLDPSTPICIAGSLATGAVLAEDIRLRTGHSVDRPIPVLTHPSNFPANEYAVNIGLALKRH